MKVPKPRKPNGDFFGLFEEAAQNNVEAAKLLDRLCHDFSNAENMVTQLHEREHQGDEITHSIYQSLNKVFMPPLDREDIIAITSALDDVIDHIHEAADAMCVYNVKEPTTVASSLATIIVACTEAVAKELPRLRQRRTMRDINGGVIELHRLENQADHTAPRRSDGLVPPLSRSHPGDRLEPDLRDDGTGDRQVRGHRRRAARARDQACLARTSRRCCRVLIALAVAFDFINGFHDTANAVATVISTRVMKPWAAIVMAGILNFAGAMSGTEVAKTVGSGIVGASVPLLAITAALVGAIAWNLITWYYGIPSSSSHALIGSLLGAGVASLGIGAVHWSVLQNKVVLPLVLVAGGRVHHRDRADAAARSLSSRTCPRREWARSSGARKSYPRRSWRSATEATTRRRRWASSRSVW